MILSYLKLANNRQQLHVLNSKYEQLKYIELDSRLRVIEMICHGEHIVVLSCFFKHMQKNYILKMYNSNLQLTACRNFDKNIKLLGVNNKEIICGLLEPTRMVVLNANLEDKDVYGQDVSPDKPFYFKNGSLIDVSSRHILYYFTEWLNEDPEADMCRIDSSTQKHYVKVICRRDGHCIGQINFEFGYFSRIFKIDFNENILFKPSQSNALIEYYNTGGRLLASLTCDKLASLSKGFTLTNNNQIMTFDKHERKIFIF